LPDVAVPCTSVLLTTVKLVAESPFWLPSSLKIKLAAVVDGKVKSAMPVLVVAVSAVVTPLLRATWYSPACADSLECENESVAEELTAPTVGSTGMSPSAPQPGPDRWSRLKPVIAELLYS
jgi:hypothetical protein